MDALSRHDSRSALSDCSYSSGFQSMLGSPTGEGEFWSNIQDLESRVNRLENPQPRHPYTRSLAQERSRHDSASSCNTVMDSCCETHTVTDMEKDQLVFQNNMIVTQATLNDMRKFKKVEFQIAIVGTELRGPEECTCSHDCTQNCQTAQTNAFIAQLQQQLGKLAEENLMLKQKNRGQEEEEEANEVVQYSEETSKAHIEELSTSENEKTQTFSIKSVVDPSTQKVISLDDAIAEKIIQLEKGIYFNNNTGEEMTIPDAMNRRLISVVSKRTRWSNVHEATFGIMTIQRNVTPQGTLLVKQFKDTHTGEMVSRKVAIERGITDSTLGVFKDLQTGETVDILRAIDQGDVTVDGEVHQPEVTQCFYKVSGVIDKQTKEVLSFRQAVSRGILVKENGMCKDTSSGKYVFVTCALLSGLLKVNPIDSASHLEALQN